MSFLLILVGILKKGRNQKNLGNFGGPTPRCRDHTQQRRSTPRRGMCTPRCGREEVWSSLGYAAA